MRREFVPRRQRVKVFWKCTVCSVATNRPYFKICEVCGVGTQPDDFQTPDWYEPDEEEQKKLDDEELNEQLTQQLLNNEDGGNANAANQPVNFLPAARGQQLLHRDQVQINPRRILHWQCDLCSYNENRPYFNFCEVCAQGKKPDTFEIPHWYQPDADEQRKLEEAKRNEELTLQM